MSEAEGPSVRIYVVEDHPIMRESLVDFLEAQPAFQVVGSAQNGEEAIDAICSGAVEADVVLVDLRLPGMSGIPLVRSVKEARPELVCLVLSGHGEGGYVEDALSAGASGYVLKGDPTEVPTAIREVMAGRTYRSPALNPPK